LRTLAQTHYSFKENPMLVTFTTEAYADITMFGDVALTLLKMMGHSATVPGAILAADVPEALQKLTLAVEAEDTSPPVDENDENEPTVSLPNRARPLIELLTAAVEADVDVMWK
jgi:hypothetical protein